jgi:Fe2+ or Zn2+ uptake regulation protein
MFRYICAITHKDLIHVYPVKGTHTVYNASKHADHIHMYCPNTGFTCKVLCDGTSEVETTNDSASQQCIFISSQV